MIQLGYYCSHGHKVAGKFQEPKGSYIVHTRPMTFIVQGSELDHTIDWKAYTMAAILQTLNFNHSFQFIACHPPGWHWVETSGLWNFDRATPKTLNKPLKL